MTFDVCKVDGNSLICTSSIKLISNLRITICQEIVKSINTKKNYYLIYYLVGMYIYIHIPTK